MGWSSESKIYVKGEKIFEYTEYELQKRRNKQELVRNEFKTVGKYQIPLIRKQDIDLDSISLISFSDIKQDDKENAYKTVLFLPMIGCLKKCMKRQPIVQKN